MTISESALKDVFVGHLNVFSDNRGLFSKIFGAPEIAAIFGARSIRQVNLSETEEPGTIRGLHFQHPPHAELKMIVCLSGTVYDVAVDLRARSKTLAQHVGATLAPFDFIIIPEGCAHGFQALARGSRLLYLHTADYMVKSEDGFRFDDEAFNIHWPLSPMGLSDRDLRLPRLPCSYLGIDVHV